MLPSPNHCENNSIVILLLEANETAESMHSMPNNTRKYYT